MLLAIVITWQQNGLAVKLVTYWSRIQRHNYQATKPRNRGTLK